jgi:hypothetical protein
MTNKQSKLIESITIKHIVDNNPDTSYLGKYSNDKESEISIDRKHSLDCVVNNGGNEETINQLERVIRYLQRDCEIEELDALNEAQDILIEKQDELAEECDCGGVYIDRLSYRFFNPSDNYKGLPIEDQRKYVKQDYKRIEALENNDWNYLGIRADALIRTNGIAQEITSGAIWGIESDSSESYIKEIEQEQLAELREQLYTLGFNKRAIATACKKIERKDA